MRACLAVLVLFRLVGGVVRLSAADPFLPPHGALPYAHRGVKLWQVEAFANAYALNGASGLSTVCSKFNSENEDRIALPESDPAHLYPCDSTHPQAYDMVDHLIVPLTDPDRYSSPDAPQAVGDWSLPAPKRNISMAELLNPEGFPEGVDAFMSWSWTTEMKDLVSSLRRQAEAMYQEVNKTRPEDVVFWICAFVLNQHQVADELNWDLSMAPFRLGLEQAKGAILLLNNHDYGSVLTAWNYYEVLVTYVLSKSIWPIGPGVWEEGQSMLINGVWGDSCTEKKMEALQRFDVANGTVDYRTGASDDEWKMIRELISSTQIGISGLTNRIRGMLSSSMSYYAMQKIVDGADLLNQRALQDALPYEWLGTQASLFPSFTVQSQQLQRLLRSPESVPSCPAEVPLGLTMHKLSAEAVARHDKLLCGTEVEVSCRGGPTYRTACHCSGKYLDDPDRRCEWSTPRLRGPKPSCWPQHESGELDCDDGPALPPKYPGFCQTSNRVGLERCQGWELKELVCEPGSLSV